MNFGFNAITQGTVIHEFLHALGMIHEHQNPKGNTLPWNETAVYNYFSGPPNNWSVKDIDRNVLGGYSETQINGSTYDPLSIMHYRFNSDLFTEPVYIPDTNVLSGKDKEFLNLKYSESGYVGEGGDDPEFPDLPITTKKPDLFSEFNMDTIIFVAVVLLLIAFVVS